MGSNEQNTNPHYRDGTAAGFKGNSLQARQNSAGAAQEVTKGLGARHAQMMHAWAFYGPSGAIPEDIANDLDLSVHIVRPRAGELVKKGLLFEIGRRPGGLGHNVTIYSVERPTEQAA